MKAWAAITLVLTLPLVATAQAQPQPVQAPHHGEVLFHHFQGRWVAALGALMVSQHFDRLAPHDADAELLRGGLLLDWGQHDEAAAVFARVAGQHPLHRDRAWTMLARARWQRGRVDDAEAALARVQAPLPGERDDERVLLQAQVHLARGRAAEAAAVLQPLADRQQPRAAQALAQHNRAIALLQSGQVAAAQAELDRIGRSRAATEEQRVLRDRANLTLALAALRQQPPDAASARSALQRVRLHGTASARALLADGWAALQQGRAQDALVPWLEGAARPATEPAVFEARLAVPQAYARLGARGEALARTEALLQAFETEAQALADARQALLDGRALAPLLQQALQGHEPGREPEVRLVGGALTETLTATLAPVWAEHPVQQALTRWADLRWVAGDLQRWQRALPAFDDLLALRREAFAQRLPPTLRAAMDDATGLALLARQQAELAQVLAAADGQDDGQALATDVELAQRQRLQRMHQDLATLPPSAETAALAERLRRVQGVWAWQLAQARPERLWTARKALRDLDQGLGQARQRLAALQQAQAQQPARLDALAQRTAALAQAVAALQPRVLALADEQQAALQGLAVAVIDRHQQQLAAYAWQARLLQTQLQDGSLSAQADAGGGDARP
jgi:hypothetical protein